MTGSPPHEFSKSTLQAETSFGNRYNPGQEWFTSLDIRIRYPPIEFLLRQPASLVEAKATEGRVAPTPP